MFIELPQGIVILLHVIILLFEEFFDIISFYAQTSPHLLADKDILIRSILNG
jgi:hypothetical protein